MICQRAGLDRQIPAGFVLAGGGAKLTGLIDLAEQLLPFAHAHRRAKGLADMPEQVAPA